MKKKQIENDLRMFVLTEENAITDEDSIQEFLDKLPEDGDD